MKYCLLLTSLMAFPGILLAEETYNFSGSTECLEVFQTVGYRDYRVHALDMKRDGSFTWVVYGYDDSKCSNLKIKWVDTGFYSFNEFHSTERIAFKTENSYRYSANIPTGSTWSRLAASDDPYLEGFKGEGIYRMREPRHELEEVDRAGRTDHFFNFGQNSVRVWKYTFLPRN